MRGIMVSACITFLCVIQPSNTCAQWRPTNGPYGGVRARFLTSFGRSVFAITDSTVYRSTDSGSSWARCNRGLPQTYLTGLCAAGPTILVTTGNGIFASKDTGATWSLLTDNPLCRHVWALNAIGYNLVVFSDSGLVRSTDCGITWLKPNIDSSFPVISLLFSNGVDFFATDDYYGFFRSTDSGSTWTAINLGLQGSYVTCFAANGTALCVGTRNGLFLSSNNGDTWRGTHQASSAESITWCGTRILVGTGEGVYVSTDAFGFQWMSGAISHPLSLAVIGPNVLAGSLQDGIFKSVDSGGSWTPSSKGLGMTGVTTLATIGTTLFAGTWGESVFRSSDNGASWIPSSNGLLNNDIGEFVADGLNLFAGDAFGFARSIDGGKSWTNSEIANGFATAITGRADNLYISSSANGIFRSSDSGSTWVKTALRDTDVLSLALIGNSLFAGTSRLDFSTWNYDETPGIIQSTDSGKTWIWTSDGIAGHDVLSFGTDGLSIFAGTGSDSIFRSTDGGMNWVATNTDLKQEAVHCFANSVSGIWAGTDSGVLISKDGGLDWTGANEGLSHRSVHSLNILGSTIFAGTDSGVWRRPISEFFETVANEGTIPQDLHIFPNPCTSSCNISYVLPSDDVVSIVVRDILGRVVANPVTGQIQIAGTHSVDLNVISLPAGIYWCMCTGKNVSLASDFIVR